ncbi:DUF3613 domain-containing protein [Collimonas sp.]|jgi:hypothetical protein|uniref:DUF3613 domain-containing protein n=1 Tax=Collimonas sp. TaxID=1963772 RepID=UPI002C59F342|nr:DUF3613 domain-containing protein [Collimonas sp.]HWW99747.1 DUF3613 domain-containing protein [Collimonas sp.]
MKAQGIFFQRFFLAGSILLAAAAMSEVYAQNMTPLTGTLLQEPVSNVNTAAPVTSTPSASYQQAAASAAVPDQSSSAATPPERYARVRIGDVTHTLLQAQADGRVAGARLPMLGATADVSWQRYLDSFKHPLPEFYENKVTKKQSN